MKQFVLTSHGSTALYQDVLREILGGDTAQMDLLDIGCGRCAQTSLLPWKAATLCDLVDEPERPQGFGTFHQVGALDNHEIFRRTYDVAYCGDCLEHLTKAHGILLLQRMRNVLKYGGTAIIFTPLGNMMVDENATDPHAHKSGWLPEELNFTWDTLVFPQYHPTLNAGAFFAWRKNT